ncbi:MAG: phosphatidate cytidylyltransferase [Alphaproteobacteria bacterium]|nr:phosphatidate cytidylyltransferase [Alphaproteobacteria bacterium]
MSVTLSKSLKTELYRKAVHLSSLWMPPAVLLLNRNASIILFACLLGLNLIVERAACLKTPFIGTLFRRMFIKTLRHKEVCRKDFVPSGSVYILAAALIVSVCYTPKAAAAAMSIMLISDSCAAVFGKFWGSHRFENGKSAEGTLAFFVSAFLITAFFFPALPLALLGLISVLATAAEFFERELQIDDNFAIPVITGFILNLISL